MAAASPEVLTQQVVDLTDAVKDLRNRIAVQEQLIVLLKNGGGDSGDGASKEDRKVFEPGQLTDAASFREWAEDFVDFTRMRYKDGEKLGDLLMWARTQTNAIMSLGDTPEITAQGHIIYRWLKKLVFKHKEACAIV